MADQLTGYEPKGDDRVYKSIRLEGMRRGPPSQAACEAHLFEMYWSDLVRLRTGIFGVFGGIVEVYQILFQLCILGRHNLDFALAQEPRSMAWRVFKFCQSVTEWF
jgi:hypothetical protein